MSSVADSPSILSAVAAWSAVAPSRISHHGHDQCELTRLWFMAIDASLSGVYPTDPPTWIRESFDWGPRRWPLHWCEIRRRDSLDCGALAALSCEVFRARGQRCVPVQLIQSFSEHDAAHWRRRWQGAKLPTNWIRGPLVYHEACGVLTEDPAIRIWDSTDNVWIEPDQMPGYAATVAIRVSQAGMERMSVAFGRRLLPIGTWTVLEH